MNSTMRAKSRPATSIFNRPVKRKPPTKMGDIDFHVGVDEPFGKNAPKIGIGSSRRPAKPPDPTPDPGQYDPPASPIEKKIYHKISTEHGEIRDCMTTNIDYIDSRAFPQVKPRAIGSLTGEKFFTVNDVPFCKYSPPSTFEAPKRHISCKPPDEKPNGIPSPAHYRPSTSFTLPTEPIHKIAQVKSRYEWMVDERNVPSPNTYNPKKMEKQAPIYSIGYKSRRKRKNQHLVPFAVDTFIAKIEPDMIFDSQKFIKKHPELPEIVRDIFENIYEYKPENPILFLKEHFEEKRHKLNKDGNSWVLPDGSYDYPLLITYLMNDTQRLT